MLVTENLNNDDDDDDNDNNNDDEETEYRVQGKKENSDAWRPLRGLREGCATSPILFNVYHSAAMRQAAEKRKQEAKERGMKVGIGMSWRPGNSSPPKSI